MNDNFDLRKFLVESKSIENMNPIFRKLNENKETPTESSPKENLIENALRAKIREMVLNELGGMSNTDEMDDEEWDGEDAHEYFFDIDAEEEDDLYEAKKDKEEDTPADDAELDLDMDIEKEMDAPTDELSAAAAGATGDSKELINHLMTSLETAKSMGNEKLTTQIMNTLKFAIDQSMA